MRVGAGRAYGCKVRAEKQIQSLKATEIFDVPPYVQDASDIMVNTTHRHTHTCTYQQHNQTRDNAWEIWPLVVDANGLD